MTEPYLLESAAATQRGGRPENQDTVLHRSQPGPDGCANGLYVVCDGFGPGDSGKQASELAVRTADRHLADIVNGRHAGNGQNTGNGQSPGPLSVEQRIARMISHANEAIFEKAQTMLPENGRMGTTLNLVLAAQGRAYVANIGDSRTYIWRDGRLSRLTEDHSLPGQLAAQGYISEQQMLNHPYLNVLDRALGVKAEARFDLFVWPIQAGDKLLLCSDGLWKAFADSADLGDLLAADLATPDICLALMAEASRRDASDNVSAVLVEVQASAAGQERRRAAVSLERVLDGPCAFLARYS